MEELNEGEVQMPPSYPPSGRKNRDNPAKTAESEKPARKALSFLLEIATILAIALLISVIIKTFFAQVFSIPSESMADTLVPGDRIVVNKMADSEGELERGDVIVFVDPGNWLDGMPADDSPAWRKALSRAGQVVGILPQNVGDHLVKRLIGMPGDHVTCCNEIGQISVNGKAIDEPYLRDGLPASTTPFDVVVPKDHVWVLGDNRFRSKDSRFHQQETGFGFVPISNIEGRAWLRIYPFDRIGRLPAQQSAFDGVPEAQVGSQAQGAPGAEGVPDAQAAPETQAVPESQGAPKAHTGP